MKKTTQKALAVLMTVCLLISISAVGAFAADTAGAEPAAIAAQVAGYAPNPAPWSETAAAEPSGASGIAGQSLTSPDFAKAFASGLHFNADGEFKILQLSDLEDDTIPYSAMLKYIQLAIADTKPNLIVLTGDITGKTTSALSAAWISVPWIANLVNKVPFTLTFGETDSILPIGKNSLLGRYQKYSNCKAYDEIPEISGVANHNLFVFKDAASAQAKKIDENLVFNLWMLDTNANGLYNDQADWYAIREDNLLGRLGYSVPSMIFTHRPLPEITNVIKDGKLADPVGSSQSADDQLKEAPPNDFRSRILDHAKNYGDVFAAVSGYNHINRFVRTWEYQADNPDTTDVDESRSMDFIQTGGMTFNAYGNPNARGGRLITLKITADAVPAVTDDDGNIETPAAPAQLEYTTKYLSYFNYFDFNSTDISSKVFYQAGANWFFGPLASMLGQMVGIFTDKYKAAFEVTQWFGDMFNKILK
jgi:hypothetical protein